MIRSILVDLDGVLRFWDPDHDSQVERTYGLAPGAIRTAAFEPDLLLLAVTGRISDEDWRQRIAAGLTVQLALEDAVRAVADWSESVGHVDPDVLGLLTACRRQASVHVLTNATSRLGNDLRRLGLSDALNGVVSSAEVGIAKPEAGIYEAALSITGVSAAETLFVDDTHGHVRAARFLGIIGHVFVDVADLRSELIRQRVLSASD